MNPLARVFHDEVKLSLEVFNVGDILDNTVTHSFEPIYNNTSKILILGTMPSPKSRQYGFYYSNPQNRFWKVISTILNQPIPQTVFEKIEFLHLNSIALWDVLKSCNIVGADDNSIKNPVVNDISKIISATDIKYIFTTGKKATSLYKRYCFNDTKLESIYLPSTSPANCRHYSFDDLINEYKIILNYL